MSTTWVDHALAREIATETVREFGPDARLADACIVAADDARVSAADVPAYERFMDAVMEYVDDPS
ncbi:hypothetical protein ACU686_12640 [Yinghuangia aomiensis]